MRAQEEARQDVGGRQPERGDGKRLREREAETETTKGPAFLRNP
jgi:hypothetical protein